MRIKKKSFLGKLLLLLLGTVFALWFMRNDVKSPFVNNGDYFREMGVNPSWLSELSETLTWQARECLSSAGRMKVTADFTLNSLLDAMTIEPHNQGYAKGKLQSNITKFVHKIGRKALESDPLEIIVIPHSHNDPGWKKTYMKYFEDQTTHILTNIVDKLTQYPDMTFVWVESCFLDVWWRNQTQSTRTKFVNLVKSHRLEIVSGMWVAPDEASPHYFQLIDQMIEGHYWIKTNLGVVPESSLNFDQFGYSASMPYLVHKTGIKNVLIKRIHRAVKDLMGEKNWMTFQWRQFWDPEGRDDIRGHIDTYEWMAISDSCGPDRTVCRGLDFTVQPDLPEPGSTKANQPVEMDRFTGKMAANLSDFVHQLVNQFKLKAANYRQNVMMMPHGGDFHFAAAPDWDKQHRNLRLFMDYVNSRQAEYNVRMRFGTLKDYYDTLDEQTKVYNLNFPVVSGDFFTYTESTDYWTGYFTTRMFDKRLSRELMESLRTAELFSSIIFNSGIRVPGEVKRKMIADLVTARQDLGVFMHHDAVTGTSRLHVVKDYEERLSNGFLGTQAVLENAIEYILHNRESAGGADKIVHTILNRTAYNALTERIVVKPSSSGVKLILVNSLTQIIRDVVTVTLDTSDVTISDHKGEPVEFDSVEMKNKVTVMFHVRLPPVSLLVYTIKKVATPSAAKNRNIVKAIPIKSGYFGCSNSYMNITFSETNGSPTQICYKSEDYCTKFEVDWRHFAGNGGAYTMRSDGVEQRAHKHLPKVVPMIGTTFCGAKFEFDFFSAAYILPTTKAITGKALRIEVTSDLSKTTNFRGDLAMRLNTGIKNGDLFYVDSNGIQMLKRKFRQTIPFDGNVYPMTSMTMLQDDSLRMVLHSAQPHGVISRTSGTLDVMIDRIAPRPEMDLPEGAFDSKPTLTIFLVEFESRRGFDKVAEEETTLPSINSVFLNDILQHPIFSFVSFTNLRLQRSVHTFLKQKIPCDVTIANIRNLASADAYKLDGVSMTLFRRAVTCQSDRSFDAFCPLFEPMNLKPGLLIGLQKGDLMNTKEMFLSHLMEKGDVSADDVVNISPMDIKTFHLTRN